MGYARRWIHRHPYVYAVYKSDKFRLATSPFRIFPNFAIIGAQKSGTTSLYDFVTRHPNIASARKKEIHFFSSSLYGFGLMWYRSNFPTRISRYYYKKNGKKLLVGEATPYYLFHPLVPERMKRVLPDIKLIAILRNPVDRTYSHYNFALRQNRESLSFEEALDAEGDRMGGHRERIIQDPNFDDFEFKTHSYLSRSIYVDQLSHWFKYYDRSRFLIVSSEDLAMDPQRILDQIFDFLGVPPYNVDDLRDLNVYEYSNMSESTRKFLTDYFEPHNQRLFRLLGTSFDW